MARTNTNAQNRGNPENSCIATARGLRLVTLRKTTRLSIKALCEKYNIGYSTLRQWEHARVSGLSKKGAKKIIDAVAKEGVRCSLSWLLHGIGQPPMQIDAKRPFEPYPEDLEEPEEIISEELHIRQEMEFFRSLHQDHLILEIYDDGMLPHYQQGDCVAGISHSGDQIQEVMNLNCIIETDDYQLFCRRLTPGEYKNTYNLYCLNPNTSAMPVIQTDVIVLRAAPISRLWCRIQR